LDNIEIISSTKKILRSTEAKKALKTLFSQTVSGNLKRAQLLILILTNFKYKNQL